MWQDRVLRRADGVTYAACVVLMLLQALLSTQVQARIVQGDAAFCNQLVGPGQRTVLLSADPGAYIGIGKPL